MAGCSSLCIAKIRNALGAASAGSHASSASRTLAQLGLARGHEGQRGEQRPHLEAPGRVERLRLAPAPPGIRSRSARRERQVRQQDVAQRAELGRARHLEEPARELGGAGEVVGSRAPRRQRRWRR